MRCERLGCPGEMVDGYCSICGYAPSATAATSATKGTVQGQGDEVVTGPTQATAASTPTGTRRTDTRSSATHLTLRRGLVDDLAPVRGRDPNERLLDDPQVPEARRFCAKCKEPVGRDRFGRPGRTEGFCPACRHPFSFVPKLGKGDLVANQYRIMGCLAHGGLGWVYLARDTNVEDHLVVLKGLLNPDDPDAREVNVAERRFLAEVDHPDIVRIYNFVQHGGLDYLVMEYVDGESLKSVLTQLTTDNDGLPTPMDVSHAIAFMLSVLPALGYLHDHDLVYCDFKPDNVMRTPLSPTSVKLIDLGAVCRLSDPPSTGWGTDGYRAPEVAAHEPPTVASDLYTVGRTLAVMCGQFRGRTSTYLHHLPPAAEVPAFSRYPSLYRLLQKATAPSPSDRFQSAGEMSDQLEALLCEVVALSKGSPRPRTSHLLTAEGTTGFGSADWRVLPTPLVSVSDPSASFLATVTATTPDELLLALDGAPEQSVEIDLQRARALINTGRHSEAVDILDRVHTVDPWEWRVDWYRGVTHLAVGSPEAAFEDFDAVYSAVPGELAPKLALALAAEQAGNLREAARWYDLVSRVDQSYPSAAFGLARCSLALDMPSLAVESYDRVPESSSAYVTAQTGKARAVLASAVQTSSLAEIAHASRIVNALPLHPEQHAALSAEGLNIALDINAKPDASVDPTLQAFGVLLTPRGIRSGLEDAYRTLARHTSSMTERIRLVDLANAVRPRSLT